MPVYTPPALNAVDFALVARTPQNVDPYDMALVSYTAPALNAVNFALVSYTSPVYNTIDFEFLGGSNWTKNLADSITLSDSVISKGFGLFKTDEVVLSDNLSGGATGEDGVFRSIEYWAYIYFGTNGIFRKAFKYVVSIIS